MFRLKLIYQKTNIVDGDTIIEQASLGTTSTRVRSDYLATIKSMSYISFLSIMLVLVWFISSLEAADIIVNDKSQFDNLFIDSDRLTINKLSNCAHFEGSVVIQFEDLVIYTSELDVIYKTNKSNKLKTNSNNTSGTELDENTKIEKIIIPNKLQAIREKNQEVLIADGGEYICDECKLILTGDIKFMHQDSVLKTKKLVYYTALKKSNSCEVK